MPSLPVPVSGGVARVDAPDAGFDELVAVANGGSADVRVTSGSNDVVHLANSAVVEVDTTATHARSRLVLVDEKVDTEGGPQEDVQLDLLVPTGSINAGNVTSLIAEDDIVFGDADGVAVTMHAVPLPPGAPPGGRAGGPGPVGG